MIVWLVKEMNVFKPHLQTIQYDTEEGHGVAGGERLREKMKGFSFFPP